MSIDEHKMHDYMAVRHANLGKKLYPKLVSHAHSYIDSIAGDHVYNGDDWDDRLSHSKNLDRAQARGMMVPGRDHVVHAHAEHAAEHLHRKFKKHPGYSTELAHKASIEAGKRIWGSSEPEDSDKHQKYKEIDDARAARRTARPVKQPKPKQPKLKPTLVKTEHGWKTKKLPPFERANMNEEFKRGDKVFHPKGGKGTVRLVRPSGQVVVDHKKFKSMLDVSRHVEAGNPSPVMTYNPESLRKVNEEEQSMTKRYTGPVPLNSGAQWSERQTPIGMTENKTQYDYEREALKAKREHAKNADKKKLQDNRLNAALGGHDSKDIQARIKRMKKDLKESPAWEVHTQATDPISRKRMVFKSVYHGETPREAESSAETDHQQRGHLNIKARARKP